MKLNQIKLSTNGNFSADSDFFYVDNKTLALIENHKIAGGYLSFDIDLYDDEKEVNSKTPIEDINKWLDSNFVSRLGG